MTYSSLQKVQLYPSTQGGSSDAFGLLRISEQSFEFSSFQPYNSGPIFWNTVLTTGGTSTHVPAESTTTLAVTTTSGSEVVRQTKHYIQYQPGRSQKVLQTFVLNPPLANLLQQVGFGDSENGYFFETLGTTARFFLRTKTSGTVVETTDESTAVLSAGGLVTSSNWNLDKLDGTGSADNPSGLQLDVSKAQIMILDFQWLGVGSARMGFVINEQITYAHVFHHTNATAKTYTTTATLPAHFRIKANAGLGSAASMKAICAAVASGGGVSVFDRQGMPFSQSNTNPASAVTGLAVNSAPELALFAIRLKNVLNNTGQTIFSGAPAGGITNRALVIPKAVNFEALSRAMVVRIYWVAAGSGSTFTGGTWTSVNDHSVVQYNSGITSFSLAASSAGVIKVEESFVDTSGGFSNLGETLSALRLDVNLAGTASDVLFMTVQRLESNNSIVWGGFSWKELYS